jgi:hypothetical protein
VGFAVVVAAQEASVGEVGAAALGPGDVVVGLGPAGWAVAAFGGAAALGEGEGEALVFGVQAAGAAHVEDHRGAVDEAS